MKKSSDSWSTKTKALTIVVCVAMAVVPTSSLGLLPPYPETTIHIINGLPAGSPVLSLHCKSKDDDLGFQQLGVGQEFKWSFSRNVWIRGMTLFYCSFWWNSKQMKADVYNTFDFDVNKEQFYYKAEEHGIFFSYDQKSWYLRTWDN